MKAYYILPLFILISCTPVADITSGSSIKSSSSTNYKWELNSFPINISVSNDFSLDEKNSINQMASNWEEILQNEYNFFTLGNTTEEVSSFSLDLNVLGNDQIYGVYKIQNWPSDLSGAALAVTQIFARRINLGKSNEYLRIEHADILMNYDYYDFRSTKYIRGSYDFNTVVLHELGHFLGLSHKTRDSVMVSSINSGTEITYPTDIDSEDLGYKYGSVSSVSSFAIRPLEQNRIEQDNIQTEEKVRIIIELRSDGECLHYEDGALYERHQTKIKKL